MNRGRLKSAAGLAFGLAFFALSSGAAPAGDKSKPGVFVTFDCIGGDAIDFVSLDVRFLEKEDFAELEVVAGATRKDDKSRYYKASLEKGSFKKMMGKGRIEMTLISKKREEHSFGGETMYAALLALTRTRGTYWHGYLAADGSVFRIECSTNPMKDFSNH